MNKDKNSTKKSNDKINIKKKKNFEELSINLRENLIRRKKKQKPKDAI